MTRFVAIRSVAWAILALMLTFGLYLTIQGVKEQQALDRDNAAQNRKADARKQQDALNKANGKVEQLGQQLRGLGETPVVSTQPVPVPQGVPGARGQTGSAGPRGLPGLPGDQGSQGIFGKPGKNGSPGAAGEKGDSGAAGSTGPKGDTGATGPKGDPGPAGTKGDPGEPGTKGDPGATVTGVTCTGLLTPVTFTFTLSDGRTLEASCG